MLQLARREQPVKWNTLFCDLLCAAGFTPTSAVKSSLDALTLYAASSHDTFNNTVAELQAVKRYTALLLSLHAATSSWPLEVMNNLTLPPVRIGDIEVAVSGPVMEAFVVLYNGSVGCCNRGTEIVARISVEQSSNATRSSRPSSVPNADGKAAYKCFQAAAELASYAEQALAAEADNLLSSSDIYLLQRHFGFCVVREFAELCMAVTKYVYSTSFGALSSKHDTLAKLAHQAATIGLPAMLPSEIARLLPKLLLAAYHRHKAEYYNKVSGVPDMSLVLGHITYARRLLEDMEQECINDNAKKSQASRWQLLERLSAGLIGSGGLSKDDGDDDGNSQKQSFKNLVGLLEDSSLVKIFPLAVTLIREICLLYDKFYHENNVIYHTRPAREKDIVADTPEVEQLDSYANPTMQYVSLENKLHVDRTQFNELPTAEMVCKALRLRDVGHVLLESLKKQLDITQKLIQNMKEALKLPINVELELTRVESLLRRNRGAILTLDERIDEASRAVTVAWKQHKAVSDELYRAKCEYIGEYVTSFRSTASLREQERAWREKLQKLQAALAEELPHRSEAALRQTLLLPEEPVLRSCITQVAAVEAKAKRMFELNKAFPDELAVCVSNLKSVRETAEAALRRIGPLCTESRWERVARVLSGAAALIAEAERFVAAAEAETQLMEDEKSRIVVAPLPRLSGVNFVRRDLNQKRRERGARVKKTREQESSESDAEHSAGSTLLGEPKWVTGNGRRNSPHSTKEAQELEYSSEEEVKAPKAIVSASLLQRIKQKEQQLEKQQPEESGKNPTNKRRRR